MKKLFFIAILATTLCVYFACSQANKDEVAPATPTEVSDVDLTNLSDSPIGENTLIEDRVTCGVGECHCAVSDVNGAVDITICGLTTGTTTCGVNSATPCVGNNSTVYEGYLPISQLYQDFCVYSGKTFRITNNDNATANFRLQCSGNATPLNITLAANGAAGDTQWFDLTSCAAAQCS